MSAYVKQIGSIIISIFKMRKLGLRESNCSQIYVSTKKLAYKL